jgi:hypothetical protein
VQENQSGMRAAFVLYRLDELTAAPALSVATLKHSAEGTLCTPTIIIIYFLGSFNDIDFRQSGFSNADTRNTVLSTSCPNEPFCGNRNSKYRAIDGSCNNLQKPKYGQLLTPLQRILPNDYFDGTISPRRGKNGRVLPSARLVSTTIVSTTEHPSRINTALLMAVGQFIDHDITQVPIKSNLIY